MDSKKHEGLYPNVEMVINHVSGLLDQIECDRPPCSVHQVKNMVNNTDREALNKIWEISMLNTVLETYEKLRPKKVGIKHKMYKFHDWYEDEDSNVDMTAMMYGAHNGPICKRCGIGICEHCEPDWADAGPCIVDEYTCPSCLGHRVAHVVDGLYICRDCHQYLHKSDETKTEKK